MTKHELWILFRPLLSVSFSLLFLLSLFYVFGVYTIPIMVLVVFLAIGYTDVIDNRKHRR